MLTGFNRLIWINVLFSFGVHAQTLNFRVAAIYPDSGREADFQCITNGVFSEHNNKPNSHKIDLKLFSDENRTEKTIENLKAIEEFKPDLIIGTRTSQQALVIAPLAERLKVPFFVPFASHPDITKDRSYSFRFIPSSHMFALKMVRFAKEKLNPKRIVIVANSSTPYSTFYSDYFQKHFPDPPAIVKRFNIIDGYNQFEELAESIGKIQPDLIYMPLYTVEAISLMSALISGDVKTQILSHASINDGSSFFPTTKNGIKILDIYYDTVWDGRIEGPSKEEYLRVFNMACGGNHNLRTVAAFDVAIFATRAISKTKNKDQLYDQIRRLKIEGILGKVSFEDGFEQSDRPLSISKLEGHSSKPFIKFW